MSKRKESITIRLGIWGIQRAGITTYITMLDNLLRKEDKYFSSVTTDNNTLDIITENFKKISEGGIFPDTTKLEQKFDLQTYTLELNKNSQLYKIANNIQLEFIDFPSNYYERINGLKDVKIRIGQKEMSHYEYFNSCDCFLFLIENSNNNSNELANQLENFFQLLQQLRSESKISKHIAFMVTKIDNDDQLWKNANSKPSMELVKEVMGQNLFDKISSYFYFDKNYPAGSTQNHCNFYCISSIGRYKNDQIWEKVIISENTEISGNETEKQKEILDNTEPVNRESKSQSDYLKSPIRNPVQSGVISESKTSIPKTLKNENFNDWFPLNVTAPIKWLILNYPNFVKE